MAPTTLKLAVCLFTDVANTDYGGVIEFLAFLRPKALAMGFFKSDYLIDVTYFHYDHTPFRGSDIGPLMIPDRTYDDLKDGEQFDIVLVPGGNGAFPEVIQPSILKFLQRQVPGAKYVLGVCTGSWILAQSGMLDGKRATTNKAGFKQVQKATAGQPIEWVAKARWVVDGNFWTSSGVTAGIDMANAFLVHLVGEETARTIRGIVEASAREAGDDEFAEFYGLV